jgi:pilus assembly protein Flp/PilA
MRAFFKRLMDDNLGATAIEYGLILALMFIAMVGTFEGVADENYNIWTKVSNSMKNAVASST